MIYFVFFVKIPTKLCTPFFFKFQWTAAHMEAEEHFSKREGPPVPTRAEDPWLYGQRSRNTLNFGLTLLGDIDVV